MQAELRAAGLIGAQASSPASSGGGQGQKKQANPTRASATPALQGGLLRLRSKQGLEIVVGRNARQNERVTFDEAHPEDLWLHRAGGAGVAHDYPHGRPGAGQGDSAGGGAAGCLSLGQRAASGRWM